MNIEDVDSKFIWQGLDKEALNELLTAANLKID